MFQPASAAKSARLVCQALARACQAFAFDCRKIGRWCLTTYEGNRFEWRRKHKGFGERHESFRNVSDPQYEFGTLGGDDMGKAFA